ncbi:plastocyanin/azurin family copper-binding protein [Yoonia sp. 208BN28-4]|uniref:plastocyanin/azurin family copper-binding protein n=1 Tax=Yoonia sp. 208BN28-4 TaxID=3126505 RepID=UPI003095685D
MTNLTRRAALRIAASAAVLPLAVTSANADGHATNHTVVIQNFAFSPANLQIKAGDTVTWVNQDSTAHSAWESTNNLFDTGLLQPGQSASLTFGSAGSINYRCRPHANMRGTITIS